MVDLTTRYLGLTLRSPVVASSSPLTGRPHTARRLEDAGVAAIVLPSLFEEEITRPDGGPATYADVGNAYLDRLEAMASQATVPVIASVNAATPGSWARYARWLADAGATAVELNLYHVAASWRLTAEEIEQADVETIAEVRAEIDLPLAVKLSPYYSATANLAMRAVEAGADGLVLFNRFYQPDIDLGTRQVVPRLELSEPAELRLPLRWIALLRPQLPKRVSLAATSGVSSGEDVVKAVMVGADVAMMASALLRHGAEHVETVENQLRSWLEDHDVASIAELRASSDRRSAKDPTAFERANYVSALQSWATLAR